MKFALINKSTLVNDTQAAKMAEAGDIQMREHYAPNWDRGTHPIAGQAPPSSFGVAFYGSEAEIPVEADVICELVDEIPEAPGALAYHSKEGDRPFMRIGCKVILDNGGAVLWDPSNINAVTVSSAFSHELLETAEDIDCNDWCDGADGHALAKEIADACEGDSYPVTLSDGSIVAMSNFVLPKWFDPACSVNEITDYLGNLVGPGVIDSGGYKTQRVAPSKEDQINAKRIHVIEGDDRLSWLKAAKLEGGHGRGAKRKQSAG